MYLDGVEYVCVFGWYLCVYVYAYFMESFKKRQVRIFAKSFQVQMFPKALSFQIETSITLGISISTFQPDTESDQK